MIQSSSRFSPPARPPETSLSQALPSLLLRHLLLGLLLLGLQGCAPLQDSECSELLRHYTLLLAREENPKLKPADVEELQTQAVERAKNDPHFEFNRCSKDVSRKQYQCAMQAMSADSLERCLVL